MALLLALPVQQTDFDLILERARRSLAAGRLEEAGTELESARRLRPRSPLLHTALAEVAEARGDHGAAVASWREAIRLGPDEPGP